MSITIYNHDIVYVHIDIDECLEGKHNCSKYAKCENSYGGYNCKCLVGYDGDGIMCKSKVKHKCSIW